eukprot:scaffold66661_cov79-Attheya_sp.AAC.2
MIAANAAAIAALTKNVKEINGTSEATDKKIDKVIKCFDHHQDIEDECHTPTSASITTIQAQIKAIPCC